MNTDCAFWIGKTHTVCQDYALTASDGDAACVVLADGCSSSPHTDIGARLLAHSAKRLLPPLDAGPDTLAAFHQAAAHAAAECACRLGLHPSCLDATLLTIQVASGAFTVSICGDGVVVLGRRDGTLEVFEVSFAANYPQYASYWLHEARRRQWAAQPNNEKRLRRWALTAAGVEERGTQDADLVELSGTAADYRFAAVLSDGVQSFARTAETETSRATLPVPVAEVLAALLAFKGGQGRFVQRRVQAFRKECRKRGWHHADDLALGVVWLEE